MDIDYFAAWRGWMFQRLLEQSGADLVASVPLCPARIWLLFHNWLALPFVRWRPMVWGENMVYFIVLSERPILGSRQGLSFIIPELEVTKLDARPDLEARRFLWTDQSGYHGAFAEAVTSLAGAGQSCALDGETLRYFEWLALEKAGLRAADTRDIGQLFLNMRARKSPPEIAKMQRAIDISEAALRATMAWAKPGLTEREIADRLSAEMLARGAQGLAFLLVLTGEKSGLPHGNTGDRVWGEDEFLLIDFGAKYEDYPADITRTFCAGEPSPQMRAMYEAVFGANQAARQFAKPGVSSEAVDRAAREVIEAAGLGDYFIHRLGHGLGLSVHELPNIVAGNKQLLEPGHGLHNRARRLYSWRRRRPHRRQCGGHRRRH